MARSTVADVLVDGVRRAGIPRLFIVADEARLAPLRAAARGAGLPVIDVPGARAACLMAAVTGEITEAPGAVAAAGAAVADAATALAYAARARAPLLVVAVGGDRSVSPARAKASVELRAASAAAALARALDAVRSAPRGPVVLGVSVDLEAPDAGTRVEPRAESQFPDADALGRAADLLARASRPVVVAGLGARSREVAMWLRPFAESLPAPVVVTPKARGVLPDPHPLLLGVLGGPGAAPMLLARADLVVSLGLDAVEVPAPWTCAVPALHVGLTPPAAGWPLALAVTADVTLVLEELAPRLRGRTVADWDVAELDRLKRGMRAHPEGAGWSPWRMAALARDVTPAGTIAAIDGGPHAEEIAAGWQTVAPNELLTAGAPVPAGFGLAAAGAAQLAHPDRHVLCFMGPGIDGDGLEVIARLGLPIVVVRMRGEPGASLSEASGAVARLAVGGPAALAGALGRALAGRRPVLVDVAPV